MSDETLLHLVLGGSKGIGYAYAAHYARRRDSLLLVARSDAGLREAAARLRAEGAARVETLRGDVLDQRFRGEVCDRISQRSLASILVSGPSVPGGDERAVTTEDFRRGFEVCMAYPVEIVRAAVDSASSTPTRVVVVGSSCSQEPICGNHYFIAAVLRRAMEHALECYASSLRGRGGEVVVWRPTIVDTPLTQRLAQHERSAEDTDLDPIDRLKRWFKVNAVPTAAEYVEDQLGS